MRFPKNACLGFSACPRALPRKDRELLLQMYTIDDLSRRDRAGAVSGVNPAPHWEGRGRTHRVNVHQPYRVLFSLGGRHPLGPLSTQIPQLGNPSGPIEGTVRGSPLSRICQVPYRTWTRRTNRRASRPRKVALLSEAW
jgi:hypothetical protein